MVAAAAARGLRLVGYARPGYGGSTPQPGRDVRRRRPTSAAIADALGLGRFAVMGASGGGPHALACAALLPERVTAAVTLAGLAPRESRRGLVRGHGRPGALRAAARGAGGAGRVRAAPEFDPSVFTRGGLGGARRDVGAARGGRRRGVRGGHRRADRRRRRVRRALGVRARPDVAAPVLVVQGGEDRMVPPAHADALVRGCPRAELLAAAARRARLASSTRSRPRSTRVRAVIRMT